MASRLPSPTKTLIVLLFCVIVNLQRSEGVKIQQKEKEELDKLLRSYDSRIRPTFNNATSERAATLVTINPYIIAITKVDDKHMDFSIDMYFRQIWTDERFKFSDLGGTLKYLILDDITKIWTPDIFFVNEKKGFVHDLVKPNYFVRIYPSGKVLYSTRIALTASCPMDFTWFPFDTQVCRLAIESYGWSYDDMKVEWKESELVGVGEVLVPTYQLTGVGTTTKLATLATGTYTQLGLNLVLKRNLNFYLLHVFIPSIMLVMLSWVPFWLDGGAITARMLIAVAVLLTLANQVTTFTANSVAFVSYSKSVDVWLGVCVTFQFIALNVTASVHYWRRREQKNKAVDAATPDNVEVDGVESAVKVSVTYQARSEMGLQEGNGKTSTLRLKERACELKTRLKNVSTCSKKLDIVSRVAFPIGFAVFAIVYWIANMVHYSADVSPN